MSVVSGMAMAGSHVLNGFVDEDDRDKCREVLFGESGDVTDQSTGVQSDQNHENDGDREADPQTNTQIMKFM